MSVPKFRNAKSRVRRRRAHHALKVQNLAVCPNCKAPVKPHRACAECGQYKGHSINANTQTPQTAKSAKPKEAQTGPVKEEKKAA